MDYWKPDRFKDYFLTIAHAEANQVLSNANHLSHLYLKDGFNRLQFQDNVKAFVNSQLNVIRSDSTDDQCQECIQNLKKENEYLTIQDRMLRAGTVAVHASVQLVRNGDFWGYVINGVGVVLSGMQVIAGVSVIGASLASGTIIGSAFGGMLVLHGLNGFQESVENLVYGKNDSVGLLKQGYVATAEFLGFDQRVGQLVYSSMDLTLSLYGIVRLVQKPEAWRLYYFLNTDYVRGIKEMSRKELFIEVYNDASAIKSISDTYKE
ncbi:DUF4225 domain-containing protein [Pantoea agglomerans]|uniref:DUF4225 domain-containing protein n=1 Tax=Enterobacter agglomerans TaxID=549 RepID=UPI001A8D1628|nr:DUF4225 domain-containing protein [Pantoea agglomerans]MBN9928892.1 DUF4225 domain-containing protein [Pantoea agglomerans]